jgi:Ser/Thr protein kinase RdoA (MazF antagonist)
MYLTISNLAHYLMATGVVERASVVRGDFAVAEVGRRNRNFKVLRRTQPGFFVKQVKTPEQQAMTTVWREAAFYQTVAQQPAYARLAAVMPRLLRYDARRHAIVFEGLPNMESLGERYARTRTYDGATARSVGETLATIHGLGSAMIVDSTLQPIFSRLMPWPMMLDVHGQQLFEPYGPAGAQLFAAIQQTPGLLLMLTHLRLHWTPDTVIHGDMKWDNCLVSLDAADSRVRLVDWELVDVGDAAWDVASVLKEYVTAVILARFADPNGASAPPLTLDALRPAIREFWSAYVAARGLPAPIAQALRDRAIRFTAARLITATLEYIAVSAAMNTFVASMLQSAIGILAQPEIAAAELLGYPS